MTSPALGTYPVSAVSPSSAACGQPDGRAVAGQHHQSSPERTGR